MLIFGSNTKSGKSGCFIIFYMDSEGTRGIKVQFGESVFPSGNDDSILVSSFDFVLKDSFTYNHCFNDKAYLYAWGQDRNTNIFNVTFLAYLQSGGAYPGAKQGGESTQNIDKFIDTYKKERVFKRAGGTPMVLLKATVGSSSAEVLKGHLISVTSQTYSAENNIQSFSIQASIPDIEG